MWQNIQVIVPQSKPHYRTSLGGQVNGIRKFEVLHGLSSKVFGVIRTFSLVKIARASIPYTANTIVGLQWIRCI